MAVPAFRMLSLFSGVGGLDLGLKLAAPNGRTVCYVEREAHAASALVARMADGALDDAPIWDDVTTFNGRPWRGVVDCVIGGFPCQPWSVAGARRGTEDERWLWDHIARLVREIEPGWVFLENVPGFLLGGLEHVLRDLAALGFDAEWGVLGAADAGAPHKRDRLFILAHARRQRDGAHQPEPVAWGSGAANARVGRSPVADPACGGRESDGDGLKWPVADGRERPSAVLADAGRAERWGQDAGRGPCERAVVTGAGTGRESEPQRGVFHAALAGLEGRRAELPGPTGGRVADATRHGRREGRAESERRRPEPACTGVPLWPPGPADVSAWRGMPPDLEPAICRMADGLAYRVDRLRATGNGVVPVVAAMAFLALHRRLMEAESTMNEAAA